MSQHRDRSRSSAPAQVSPSRTIAYEVLRQVAESDAYANLLLPGKLAAAQLSAQDAALATELCYGTLRLLARYDAIIELAARRPLTEINPKVLDALRLGAHQLLGMRIASHAAVHESVELVRQHANPAAVGFANGVLRTIGRTPLEGWLERLEELLDDDDYLAVTSGHPAWIVRAFRTALAAEGRDDELEALLNADNDAPTVDLVALPSFASAEEIAAEYAPEVNLSPYARTALDLVRGDPHEFPEAREGVLRVQDEGSQLVALALASFDRGTDEATESERWLDLCAGPGGKAALLASLAREAGAEFHANEVAPHRARLVAQALAPIVDDIENRVHCGDGRELARALPGPWHRILVDAPCTGLGALRRRPEARWRKQARDVAELVAIQEALLEAAVRALKPGGVAAYVTCSPHLAETTAVVQRVARLTGTHVLDSCGALRDVCQSEIDLVPREVADGNVVQLWPHRHGTDGMFLALLQRPRLEA